MEKDRLEKQETILQDEKVVCVGSQMRIMDRFGSTIRHTHYPTKFNEIKSSLRIRNVIAHPSVMYKKSAVEHVGGYRSEFNGSEDYDLWIRLSNVGQLVNLNESLTNYRIHENQASSKNKAIQIQLDANVRQRNFSKLRDKPGLLSAYLINEAINSFGIQRVYRMITATLVNPIVVLRFLIWQFLPEVIANEK
jgi:hypothetical protein